MRFQLEEKAFDLRKCVMDAIGGIRPLALQKKLTLNREVADTFPGQLVGDQARVQQILINLVGNATKYTEQGSLSVRVEKSDESAGDVGVRLVVEDTGPGISKGDLEKIFAPYVQGENLRRGSTGLGLSITQNLCRLMGGDLSAESELGEGSRFVASIRLRLAGTGEAASRSGEDSEGLTRRRGGAES